MRHYPTFLDIAGRPCLVIGGGAAALAKVRLLQRAGADVTVVAPSFNGDIGADGAAKLLQRAFRPEDLQGRALVHAASGIAEIDEAVARAAKAENIPVNVVDRAALSSFVMPAIVDRGAIVVGISSGGASPVLARRVRAEIEMLLPHGLGSLARFAQKFRSAVRATFSDFETRLRFWENFFDGPLAEALLQGDEQQAHSKMIALVNRAQLPPGGDLIALEVDAQEADLLTLRDVHRIARADVLIYDSAIAPAILDHARRDAERIKLARQDPEIKTMVAAHLGAGKRIVQLQAREQVTHAALSAV